MRWTLWLRRGAIAAVALTLGFDYAADTFPPVTDAHRALESVPFHPGAEAVILHRNSEIRFRDPTRDMNSRMLLELRVKILNEEGLRHGDLEIPHSRYFRLASLKGRTVTPDGTVIPVPEDAVFKERLSKNGRSFVTKATFPKVSPGAILDLRAEFFWDSLYFLDPWVFAQELPVLYSRARYFKPEVLAIKTWARQVGKREMQIEPRPTPRGLEFDVVLENIAGLPEEPYSFPDIDLSSRFMVIPTNVILSSTPVPLLTDWRTVCRLFENDFYKAYRKGGRSAVRQKAKDLTEGTRDPAEIARRLLSFVRDEITTVESGLGVWLASESASGDVLDAKQGTVTEKALLLQAMLEASKVDSEVLWVADRRGGRVDPEVANPNWFTGVVLKTEIGGETVFLDPSDGGNGMGVLPYYLENTRAMNCSLRKPEAVTLPEKSGSGNQRSGKLTLALDADGRFSGQGALELAGHVAWQRLGVFDSAQAAQEGWLERLGKALPGFDLSELAVIENVPGQSVGVQFKLRQRDEQVLGDEASFRPSSPLTRNQPFVLPPERRLTPVQMPFALVEEMTLELSWPENWHLDILPSEVALDGEIGGYALDIEADPESRTLRYVRRFHQDRYEIGGRKDYTALRGLHEQAFKSDGEEIVLVRE
ncbi:MAG: DUF3857 domain-containing protein [Acidobacteriota bacterium]